MNAPRNRTDETDAAPPGKPFAASQGAVGELEAFYESVLSTGCLAPADGLPLLCRAWMEVRGADWVWLWLYNEFAGRWEVVAYEPAGTLNVVPEVGQSPRSVASYCYAAQQPMYIGEVEAWTRTIDGCEYSVDIARHLREMGCSAMECVPLLHANPSGKNRRSSAPRPRSVLTLHYREGRTCRACAPSVLLLMGRMTASAITDSYMSEQRIVLAELNAIMEAHWTQTGRRSAERRKAFLADVGRLIQDRLNVRYVSIFWEDRARERLTCLYSTGLYDGQGRLLKETDLSAVSYTHGERITGQVLASGVPCVTAGADCLMPAKYTEIPPSAEPKNDLVIVCPMPFQATEGDGRPSGHVRGVIRCAGARAPQLDGRQRSFDSLQIETLGFISRQVAPMLDGLAVNIQRERTTSIVRHDLFAPLRMIADSSDEIDQDLRAHRQPPQHAIDNLKTSAFIAEQLVTQLDEDPTNIRHFKPIPTLLEGDIIARISAMLRHYAKYEAGMSIVFGTFREVPRLMVDRTLIERVFQNLITNAVKYGNEGTEITVSPLMAPDRIVVTVSNYGLGVEPDEAPHLFTENYRSPRAQRRSHGLGLGLKIAKAAMLAHGGDLELSQGKDPTVFSVSFPTSLIVSRLQ